MQEEYDLNSLQVKRRGPLPNLQKQTDTTRVRVTMMLDADVVTYFKTMAAQPGSLSYQTHINQALRRIVHSADTGQ